MTTRIFYKTTFVVEILSETPLPEDMDLVQALEEAESGSYSGDVTSQTCVQVTGAEMAKLLTEQRSDPGFFRLTSTGDDDDEELESLRYRYEEASGNSIDEHDNILDESGRFIARWDAEMARLYLADVEDEDV